MSQISRPLESQSMGIYGVRNAKQNSISTKQKSLKQQTYTQKPEERKEIVEQLNKIRFFNRIVVNSNLPSFTNQVLESINVQFFSAGQIIYHFEDQNDQIYTILQGRVKFYVPKTNKEINDEKKDYIEKFAANLSKSSLNQCSQSKAQEEYEMLLQFNIRRHDYKSQGVNQYRLTQTLGLGETFNFFNSESSVTNETVLAEQDTYIISIERRKYELALSYSSDDDLQNQGLLNFFQNRFPNFDLVKSIYLATHAKQTVYSNKQVIYNQGDESKFIYFILEGQITLSQKIKEINSNNLINKFYIGVLSKGEIFGEQASNCSFYNSSAIASSKDGCKILSINYQRNIQDYEGINQSLNIQLRQSFERRIENVEKINQEYSSLPKLKQVDIFVEKEIQMSKQLPIIDINQSKFYQKQQAKDYNILSKFLNKFTQEKETVTADVDNSPGQNSVNRSFNYGRQRKPHSPLQRHQRSSILQYSQTSENLDGSLIQFQPNDSKEQLSPVLQSPPKNNRFFMPGQNSPYKVRRINVDKKPPEYNHPTDLSYLENISNVKEIQKIIRKQKQMERLNNKNLNLVDPESIYDESLLSRNFSQNLALRPIDKSVQSFISEGIKSFKFHQNQNDLSNILSQQQNDSELNNDSNAYFTELQQVGPQHLHKDNSFIHNNSSQALFDEPEKYSRSQALYELISQIQQKDANISKLGKFETPVKLNSLNINNNVFNTSGKEINLEQSPEFQISSIKKWQEHY